MSFLLHLAVVVVVFFTASSRPVLLSTNGGGVGPIKVSLVTMPENKTGISSAEEKRSEKRKEQKVVVDKKQTTLPDTREAVRDAVMDSAGPVHISAESESIYVVGFRPVALSGDEGKYGPASTLIVPTSAGFGNPVTDAEGAGYGSSFTKPANPRYLENAHPAYPAIARSRGHEGVVILSAQVLSDGKVGGLKVAKTSGYALLDRSALSAVKNWKFDPARKSGRPIAMWVEVPIRFSLSDGGG